MLAVAAVAVVAVVIFENMPEWRMDRRYDRLLRSYDDPEKLFQRVVDDRDLLGFFLVNSFLSYNGPRCSCGAGAASGFSALVLPNPHKDDCESTAYWIQHLELLDGFWSQIVAELCDCETAALRSVRIPMIETNATVSSGDRVVFSGHSADCNFTRASQDIQKTWGPYIGRKTKKFLEAWLNR